MAARPGQGRAKTKTPDEPEYSVGTVVDALYRGVLRRAPDPDGYDANVAALNAHPKDSASLSQIIGTYLASQEYLDLEGRRFYNHLVGKSAERPDEPIRHIVSLGFNCLPSFAFKELGLKKYSLPFDWIFSHIGMVEDCIRDGFATLLDQKYYSPVLDDQGVVQTSRCNHDYYLEKYELRSLFNHRDMREPANYEYLQRCVERFGRMLASPERKLFVHLAPANWISVAQFRALYETLADATTNFSLLVLRVTPSIGDSCAVGFAPVESISKSRLVDMRALSAIRSITFADPFDDLLFRRVLASYGADGADLSPEP